MSILFTDVSQVPKMGFGKLWLTEQIQLASCFYTAPPQHKMVFRFSNDGKESKEESYFITCENYMKFQCSQMKFYCNVAMLIHLHIVRGCVCATKEEWSSCNRVSVTLKPSIITIWPFTETKKLTFGPE